MGCDGSSDLSPGSYPGQMIIYGDYFNQDTRALLIICKMAQVHPKFIKVDTLKRQNFEAQFQQLNPNSTIPVVADGQTIVLGDTNTLLNYVVNRDGRVKQMLYAEEQQVQIEAMLTWFNKKMRRTSIKLIRMVVNPIVFDTDVKKITEEDMSEFFDHILSRLEEKLVELTYLTGEKMTIVDIMVYCEIKTILKLYKREISAEKSENLLKWYEELSQNKFVKEIDGEFDKVCTEWKLEHQM